MSERKYLHLKDYLRPNGTKPYEALADDLEAELAAGNDVTLLSVPGFWMVSGSVALVQYGCAWSDGSERRYRTAKDALERKRPVK